MAINTLPDYAQDELATRETARTTALADLKTASDAAAKAAKDVTESGGKVAAGGAKVAAKNAEIAAATSATEKTALAVELAEIEIQLHADSAALAAAQKDQRFADAAVARAAKALAQATEAITEMTEAKKAIDAANAVRSALLAQATTLAGLNPTLKQQATDVKNGADYQAVQTRVNDEIPAKLRTAGRARAATVLTDVAAAETQERNTADAAGKQPKQHLGKPGAVDTAQADFDSKESILRRVVAARETLGDVVTQLKAIATAPPMPAKIKTQITNHPGATAIDLLGTEQAARDALALNEQETHDLEADLVAHPGDAGIQQNLDDHLAAHPDLVKAVAAAQAAPHQVDLWEDTVPDDAWKRLLAFDDLTRQLDNDLVPLDNAAINDARQKLADAEKVLALALSDRDKGRRETWTALAQAEQKRVEAAAVRENRPAALMAALRGDK